MSYCFVPMGLAMCFVVELRLLWVKRVRRRRRSESRKGTRRRTPTWPVARRMLYRNTRLCRRLVLGAIMRSLGDIAWS